MSLLFRLSMPSLADCAQVDEFNTAVGLIVGAILSHPSLKISPDRFDAALQLAGQPVLAIDPTTHAFSYHCPLQRLLPCELIFGCICGSIPIRARALLYICICGFNVCSRFTCPSALLCGLLTPRPVLFQAAHALHHPSPLAALSSLPTPHPILAGVALVEAPLSCLVLSSQVRARMWIRNGTSMAAQMINYASMLAPLVRESSGFVTPDIRLWAFLRIVCVGCFRNK
jgi:hypothetical protein